MKRIPLISILFVGLSGAAGCAYTGGDIGNPFHRKFHWASFVGGEDMAETCAAGSPDRARLVYNAVWGEQVRIYEWDGLRNSLRIRVVGAGDLRDIKLADPLSAWRADEAKVALDRADQDRLNAALAQSGALGAPSVGLELPSRSYYWTAATCRQGRFAFTAWKYPSAAFDALSFPAALAALDPGRDTIRPAAPIPFDVMYEYNRNQGKVMEFTLKVGGSGLAR